MNFCGAADGASEWIQMDPTQSRALGKYPTMLLSKRNFLGLALVTGVFGVEAENNPLDFGIGPEQAPKLAENAVAAIEKMDGQRMDYSPASLKVIDRLVLKFRSEGNTPKTMARTMLVFGCYVGEVLVRNLHYRWEKPSDKEYSLGFTSIGLRGQSGDFSNPIGKVFKLLLNGQEDSVAFFYDVAARQNGDKTGRAVFSFRKRVNHPVFGDGVVDAVEGNGDDERVKVTFDSGEVKWLAVKYAKLKPL